MNQINKRHLDFLKECKWVFGEEIIMETHINKEGDLIALRYGADRDCIRMLELGEEVGFFAQMIPKHDERIFLNVHAKYHGYEMHDVRDEIGFFAEEMEKQLKANEHKGGWENSSYEHLGKELNDNLWKLDKCSSHSEYRRRCANIANFAMMLADNDRREELERPKVKSEEPVDHIKDHIIATGDHDES